jgi:hypothetical protein
MPDEEVPRRRVCWGPWENGDRLGHATQARAASTIPLRVDSLVTDEAPQPRPYEELAAVRAAMAWAVDKYGPQTWARWQLRAELLRVPPVAVTVYLEWYDGALERIEMSAERRPPLRAFRPRR